MPGRLHGGQVLRRPPARRPRPGVRERPRRRVTVRGERSGRAPPGRRPFQGPRDLHTDAADDRPRASMTAAPRLETVGMNVDSTHAGSPTSSWAFFPSTSQWTRSGYWVTEWLPQTVILVMLLTGTSKRKASWLMARLW